MRRIRRFTVVGSFFFCEFTMNENGNIGFTVFFFSYSRVLELDLHTFTLWRKKERECERNRWMCAINVRKRWFMQ